MKTLRVHNLSISLDDTDTEIVKDFNLDIQQGEVHVLMGPNGSGKSTLANTLMGHPKYAITRGKIFIEDDTKYNIHNKTKSSHESGAIIDLTELNAHKRAKQGLFLSFQYPQEILGVSISHFLRTAYNEQHEAPISVPDFQKLLKEKMKLVQLDDLFRTRSLNHGFSGGEKKKAEILQMAILNPMFAILDETDSGLDVDALKAVTRAINAIRSSEIGILLITHYSRILDYITPDAVHIMKQGKLVKSGDKHLPKEIEKLGYAGVIS